MNLEKAVEKGIRRLRRPVWKSEHAYILIDLFSNKEGVRHRGPWSHLYDRSAQELLEFPTPQDVINIGDLTDDYEAYVGPIDPSDTAPTT